MKTDKTQVTIRQATFAPFDLGWEFVYKTARNRAGSALARARRADPDGERGSAYLDALAYYYETAKERRRQVAEARAAYRARRR